MAYTFKELNEMFDGKYKPQIQIDSEESVSLSDESRMPASEPEKQMSPIEMQKQRVRDAASKYQKAILEPSVPSEEKSEDSDFWTNAILALGPSVAGIALGGASGAAAAKSGTDTGMTLIQQNMKDKKERAQKQKEYQDAIRKSGVEAAKIDYDSANDELKFEAVRQDKKDSDARFNESQDRLDQRQKNSLAAQAAANSGNLNKDYEWKAGSDLRKEYQSRPIVKDFNTIDSAFRNIQTVANKPDAAGDLSLIFSYMKLLDPQSTVREGEFANAQNAAGVPDQILNQYNKLKSGERLNPNQRAQFLGQAQNLYDSKKSQLEEIQSEFGSLANRAKVDPNLVYQQIKQEQKKQIPQDNNVSLDKSAVTKIINGSTYKKVDGGWQLLK